MRNPRIALLLASIVILAITADPPVQKAVAQGATATRKVVAKVAQDVKETAIDIWEGGSNSLVAVAIGSAEGTRTANGGKTRAYQGHRDPGNGVWNLGTFSYQHCPNGCAPEEADRRQLLRLAKQAEVIDRQAGGKGNLNLEEGLNFKDLANQAPRAAIGDDGVAARLAEAKAKGLKGRAAILDARARSYRESNGVLNAPGLGNSWARVLADQERRMDRVSDAIAARKLTGKEKVK